MSKALCPPRCRGGCQELTAIDDRHGLFPHRPCSRNGAPDRTIVGLIVQQALSNRQPQTPVSAPTPPTPGKIMGAGGLVTPDKMSTAPVAPNPSMNANDRYSEAVRAALIDVILDNSVILSLKDDETLTVAAMGIDVANTNPFYANNSRKLILHISGADLNLLHQQKITRDEAKNRIIEKRF